MTYGSPVSLGSSDTPHHSRIAPKGSDLEMASPCRDLGRQLPAAQRFLVTPFLSRDLASRVSSCRDGSLASDFCDKIVKSRVGTH
jgi:hypothetical protein